MSSFHGAAIVAIAAASVAGMLARPWRVPEWVWTLAGAVAIVGLGLIPLRAALGAVARGVDVYAFLIGILTLAEIGRVARVFDALAGRLLIAAGNRRGRLFALVYGLGVLVTVLLSNDTTVVVLTPAVLAALRRARLDPLPHLYACAFVANAASFVLPISNPANLVVFGRGLPPLMPWFAAFGAAAVASIVLTYAVIRWMFRTELRGEIGRLDESEHAASHTGTASVMLVLSAVALVLAASLGLNVGYTACGAAAVSVFVMAIRERAIVLAALRQVSWTIVVLVASLFIIVTSLDRAGAIEVGRALLRGAGQLGVSSGNVAAGAAVTVAATIFNNLPVGLVCGFVLQSTQVSAALSHAVLVAVDLGPNLSMSGSLATLLWVQVLRRSGIDVTPWAFMRVGVLVLTPALTAAVLLVR